MEPLIFSSASPAIPDPATHCLQCKAVTSWCSEHSIRIYFRDGNEGRYRLVWAGPRRR
jgi:hypothetical protein